MERHYRHSLFFPLLLITVGVIYLLNVLGYILGDPWVLFLKLWPLLFIIGGLDNLFTGRGYIWAVISLGLGTAFLLANFGYLPWSSFTLFLRFWPLLLIAAGLDLIFRGRSPLATVIGVLLAVVLVGGVIWFAMSGVTTSAANLTTLSQPLGNAQKLTVQITNPTGQVEIRANSDSKNAFDGKVTLAPRETIDKSYEIKNGTGDLQIKSSGEAFLPWTAGFTQPQWNLSLTNAVPLSLEVRTAAGEQKIDLRAFNLEDLTLAVAVGQLTVILPAEGSFSGSLASPVGVINISVPSGALVEFQTNGVFVAKTITGGFTVSGNRIYSRGATSQNATIHITINQPIGRLVLSEMQK